jgi:hypothetical protein
MQRRTDILNTLNSGFEPRVAEKSLLQGGSGAAGGAGSTSARIFTEFGAQLH